MIDLTYEEACNAFGKDNVVKIGTKFYTKLGLHFGRITGYYTFSDYSILNYTYTNISNNRTQSCSRDYFKIVKNN